ncbi:hypothetical protein V0288_10185 [Pannus brasiliensis CCIBt3594]|uniref:Apolipophorin-III n=1 Tax=Pannus brasiliensis CCIBt3594 TaxID=1427578 RepID=A0AAW9QT92_9CHRO
MSFSFKNLTNLPKRVFSLALSVLALTVILSFPGRAIALPVTPDRAVVGDRTLPTSPKAESSAEKTEIALPKSLEDARLFYEKTVQKTNSAIDSLSAQLASASPDKDAIDDNEDDLENLAEDLDDLAQKVGKFSKNLFRSASTTANETLQKNLQDLRQNLGNSAEILDILADDTERAEKGTSSFLKTRIEQGIDAVKQSLQESDRALQDLTSTVKAELQKAA